MRWSVWVFMFLLLLCGRGWAARSEEDLRTLEVTMAVLVNADRLEAKLQPLEYDFELAKVARAHSLDMASNGFFSHTSPTTGDTGDRIARARIPRMGFAENIVIRGDITSAEAALMESPGHRANILNPSFTHIGVGIIENAQKQLVVTQLFILAIEEMDPKAAPGRILEMVNAIRAEQGSAPLAARRSLAECARSHSEAMNKVGEMGDAGKVKMLDADRRRYKAIQLAVLGAGKLEDALETQACYDPAYDEIGIGTVLNTHPNKPPGLLWVTIILGGRRGP